MNSDKRINLADNILKISKKVNKCQIKKCNSDNQNLEKAIKNLGISKNYIEDLRELLKSNTAKSLGNCSENNCKKILLKLFDTQLKILEYDFKHSDSSKKDKAKLKYQLFKSELNKKDKNFSELYSLYLQFSRIYDL